MHVRMSVPIRSGGSFEEELYLTVNKVPADESGAAAR